MIICCGEALIDMLPRSIPPHGEVFLPVVGGSVFNTAIALGRLGEETGFFSSLSNDRFGTRLATTLKAAGVDYSLCTRSHLPTTLAFMELNEGQANYTFYDQGTAGQMFDKNELPSNDIDVAAMQFGGVSLISEPCGSAYEKLMMRNADKCVIYLDPNIRPGFISEPEQHRNRIKRMIAMSDIVKVSDEDLAWIEPELNEKDAIQSWFENATSIVLVTKGADGACAHTANGKIMAGSRASHIVDTIGAGDAFNAGILSGLGEIDLLDKSRLSAIDAKEIEPALRKAIHVASITVSRAGADSPWSSEL